MLTGHEQENGGVFGRLRGDQDQVGDIGERLSGFFNFALRTIVCSVPNVVAAGDRLRPELSVLALGNDWVDLEPSFSSCPQEPQHLGLLVAEWQIFVCLRFGGAGERNLCRGEFSVLGQSWHCHIGY